VGNNPISFVDPTGLDREIIFWSPMPQPASMFGHVSTRGANDENFSFGHQGWDKTYKTASDYIARQTVNNGRVGLGAVVSLTPEQDKKFDACMGNSKKSAGDYNAMTNNCGSAAQGCLMNAGVNLSPGIMPATFQSNLFDSGSVGSVNWYSAP
jgi:hypothetical protein